MDEGNRMRWPVGPGWQKIMDQLEADLEAVSPGSKILHVKEKFGGLRISVEYGISGLPLVRSDQ